MEVLNDENYGPITKGPFSENWLVESILVTLLCCLPFGIVGIIKASEVNTKLAAKDYEGAENARLEARKWTRIGFFCGIGVLAFYLILIAAGASAGF